MNALTTRIDICIENKCNNHCIIDNSMHCHVINSIDVSLAIGKLKSRKINEDGLLYSDNFIHGTELLHLYLSLLFNSMIYHSYAPPPFISASVIPIPKGQKALLTDSDKYRSIAISSTLSKIFDHVIINSQSEVLKTSDYQYGFKSKSSTVAYYVAPW